jgi:DNA-binding transcriptional MerR regulator
MGFLKTQICTFPCGQSQAYAFGMFMIGAFARLAGVSAKLLRAYDELGLFVPAWADPNTGYRYYSPAQLPDIRRIVALRDMGMPLADIRRIQAEGDIRGALERRRAELKRERAEIDRRLAALDIRVEMAADGSDVPDVVVRQVRAEHIATLPLVLVPNRAADAAFYELESAVRDLKVRASRPPGALLSRGPDGAPRAEVYVPVTRQIAPTERIGSRELPAARVATLIHRGSYGTLANARRTLAEWARAAGLAPAGELRILYLQFGAEPELGVPKRFLVEHSADLVTELQLPLRAD